VSVGAVGVSNLMLRLAAYRWFLLLFPMALALAVGTKSLLSPQEFTAYARLLPPQANNTTASSLASQIGGNAVLGAAALTLKNPSDLYASLFLSRSVQDDVIENFQLTQRYQENDMDVLRDRLARNTKVEVGRDGIITLAFTDNSSVQAAAITNGMIQAMYHIAKRLARSEAMRRSEFYDVLIEESIAQRELASNRLMEFEIASGLTRLKGQEEASSSVVVELQGLIATREVELRRMAVVATENHPDMVRMRAELAGLREQLRAISRPHNLRATPSSAAAQTSVLAPTPSTSAAASSAPAPALTPATPTNPTTTAPATPAAGQRAATDAPNNSGKGNRGQVGKADNSNGQILLPFQSYAALRRQADPLRREEQMASEILEQLIRTKALSRVDESRDLAVISVLDAATPPTRKSGPRVVVNTVAAGVIGLLLAILAVLVWDLLFAENDRQLRWRQVFFAFLGRGAAR
jgi:uncharacterized protein involved in exopolysaccharide biosynthesis